MTIEQARARLEAMGAELGHEFADDYPARLGWVPRVLPLKQDLIASSATALVIVMGAVLMVLVICCANIANLQLARGAARQREMAIRRALGASSGRIAREQLIESAVVAAVGGGLGLLLTLWALDGLMQLAPESLPRRAEVVCWTVAVRAGLAARHGLVSAPPALQAARVDPGRPEDGSRSAAPTRACAQIVAEFALALVLLVSGAARAQLLAASARRSGLGFQPRDDGPPLAAAAERPDHGTVFHAGRAGPFLPRLPGRAPPALRARRDLHRPAADQREPVFQLHGRGLAGGIDRGRDRARLVRRR